jgi:hypothetical protein
MVAPEFLQKPDVRRSLNGIEPAWTMLDYGSYAVLHEEPLPDNEGIRLEPNLSETAQTNSAVGECEPPSHKTPSPMPSRRLRRWESRKPGQLESTSEGKVGLVASRLYRKPRCSTALSNSTCGSISRQCGINPTASPQPNLKPA